MNTRFLLLKSVTNLDFSDSCGQIWICEQPTERRDTFVRGDNLLLQAGSGSRDSGRGLLPAELQRAGLHHGRKVLWIFRQDGVQVNIKVTMFMSSYDKGPGQLACGWIRLFLELD